MKLDRYHTSTTRNDFPGHDDLLTMAILARAYIPAIADQLEFIQKQPHEANALRQLLDFANAALAKEGK